MIEVLNSTTAVDENGDVLPIYDVWPDVDCGPDEIDQGVARERAGTFYAQQGMDLQKAHSGNFSKRNSALLTAAETAGKSNRSWGAAQQYAADRGNNIRGASTAAERSLAEEKTVYGLARLACRVCPLSEYCDTTSGEVAKQLLAIGKNGQDARRRLRSRIGGEKINTNSHFCRDNLSDQRLPKV